MYRNVTLDEVNRRIAESHTSIREFLSYWQGKSGERQMPSRGDIEPCELIKFLPKIILVDVVADPRRLVYRLVGTAEVTLRGHDPTGKSVVEAYFAETPEASTDAYDYVIERKHPFCFREPYKAPDGVVEHDDIIFLPLSEDGRTVNMVMVYSYTYADRPYVDRRSGHH